MKKTLLAFITLVALCLISCGEKRTASPTGFEAKQVNNTIELTWNRVYEADEYCIENISTGLREQITSTSFVDKNPKEGQNDYELRACGNTYGWSEAVYVSCSFEKTGSDDGGETGNLPAPTGFVLSQTSEYVQLTWNDVSGAAGYYALWYDLNEEQWYILEETTSTSYKDYIVQAGETYIYGVAAFDSNGNNGEIAYDQITFTGNSGGGDGGGTTSKPNIPSGVKATPGSSYITVSWNSVSGADYYKVYRSTSASGSYSYINTAYSTKYTDYDVNTGITYYYKVTAENSDGESGQSAYASAKISSSGGGETTNNSPCAPSVTCSGTSSVTVRWTPSTGSGCGTPTSYDVKRINPITGQEETLKTGTTSTSYTDSQPFPGINRYGVVAYNSYGDATGQNVSSEIGIAAPTITTIYASQQGLDIMVKDLNVPDEWKQYYSLEMYRSTSYSGTYTIDWAWQYNDYTLYDYSKNELDYTRKYGVDMRGQTYYIKLRWVFSPNSYTRVEGNFSTVKTVKH